MNKTYTITSIRLDGKSPYERCWSFCPTFEGAKKIIEEIGFNFYETHYEYAIIEEISVAPITGKPKSRWWYKWDGSKWDVSSKPEELSK